VFVSFVIIVGRAKTLHKFHDSVFNICQLYVQVTSAFVVVSQALVCGNTLFSITISSHSIIHHKLYSLLFNVTEYVYCFSTNGSSGILFILFTFTNIVSQYVHWVHTVTHEYVIFTPFVGSGYFPDSSSYNHNHVLIVDKSLILTLSLDDALYDCILIYAIVHSIARIVIVTINSTRVKAFLFILYELKIIYVIIIAYILAL